MQPNAALFTDFADISRRLSDDFDVGFSFEGIEKSPFEARMSSFSLGRLKLAQLAFSPHRTRRSVRSSRTTPTYYMVNQLVSGEVLVSQDGRQATMRAGDIYLVNPAREFTLETTDVVTNSLYVDANAFRSIYPEVDCHAAIPLPQEESATTMVGEMIASVFRFGDEISPVARDRCGEAIPHILAIALAGIRSQAPVCPSRLSLFHKERIKSFVRDRLGDHRLSCELISDSLRLSQRYIYDLFADEPLTLMRWIRTERLNRCRRELSSPALRNRSVSEIAYSWGFVDLAHFSRVFSAEFGLSPRAFRQSQIEELPTIN